MPNETRLHAGEPADTHPADTSRGPGYEVRDTNVRSIVVFTIGMFLALTVTQFSMWGLLKVITGGKPERADPLSGPEVAGRQLETLRRDEGALLGGYGWADPAKKKDGPVRIPIDRAIDLIAERGVPSSGGSARTEVEVNSHSGEPAPADVKRDQDKPDAERKGGSGKGETK
jgi:hypothetical protein